MVLVISRGNFQQEDSGSEKQAKAQKVPKEEKRDPQKPVYVCELFFHAARAAIKGQNPLDTFARPKKYSNHPAQPTDPNCYSANVSSCCFGAAVFTLPTVPSITTEISALTSASYHSAATLRERIRINLPQLPPLQSKVGPPPTLKMQTVLVPPTVESSPEHPMTCTPESHMAETSPETTWEMITDAVPETEVSSDEC
ncbi:hypothetical protein ACRRTK_023437 [Alexandromys fortis]